MGASPGSPTDAFRAARNFLLERRTDWTSAYRDFRWPELERFNWALDWFDELARDNDTLALWVAREDGSQTRLTFREVAERSNRAANFLRAQGVGRGDAVLLMLGNTPPLWVVTLALMKLGAVVVPASTLLGRDDLLDRFERGGIRTVVAGAAEARKFTDVPAEFTRIVVSGSVDGWVSYEPGRDDASPVFIPDGVTKADDPLLMYFTSGTTSRPKLVAHTHRSYPIGHLSTMYWIGLQPGDVHFNISSPGWAKHAWSCLFAPWTAGATVFACEYSRFDARGMLRLIARCGITTLCAPPTVWRMFIQEDLSAYAVRLREAVSAGEPLNPEIMDEVRRAWGVPLRDGYGQTETTALIGNSPGQPLRPGSMGRPLPGYRVVLLDPDGNESSEGEVAIRLTPRPAGLMTAYLDDPEKTADAMRGGCYRTGDVARRDEAGWITFVGRSDDVFKASDYRISPFELENVLMEHDAVAEAAVVPSADPVRLNVAKGIVELVEGREPSRELAEDILRFARQRLAPYKRVRRLEFADLPKTISGKIRRVELRRRESAQREADTRGALEFWEEDFPDLKKA